MAAAIASFGVWAAAVILGFDQAPAQAPADYQSYFRQANWWPYPFFFLGVLPALWLTWRPMLWAWSKLASTGVMLVQDKAPDDATLHQVLETVRAKRIWAILTAVAIALLINLVDLAPSYRVLLGQANLDQQQRFACTYPTSTVKWIFDAGPEDGDFCEATMGEGEAGIAPPPPQLVFNVLLLAQQVTIVLLVALTVTQLLLHTALFAVFERLPVARAHGLVLRLNSRSPLNEFGLEHWNYALNNFYWAASPAMLGVFLSRAATPPEEYLPGQVMLGIAVPACLIIPMIATIIVRQMRLPAAWNMVEPEGPVAPEDFRRQQLWPLDRNWSSKLGIVLAFALAALAIGFELTQLTRI